MKVVARISFTTVLPWLLLLPWFFGAWFTGPTADDLLDAARIRDWGLGPTILAYLQGWTTRYTALGILGIWHSLFAWQAVLYPLAACLLLALLPFSLRKIPGLEASPYAPMLALGVLLSGWHSAEAWYWLTGAWVYTAGLLALPFLFRITRAWHCGLAVFVLAGFSEMEVLILGFWTLSLWLKAAPRRWAASLALLVSVVVMGLLGGNVERAAFYVEAGHEHAQDLGYTLYIASQQGLQCLWNWTVQTPLWLLALWLSFRLKEPVPNLAPGLLLWLGLLWMLHMPYVWATGMSDAPLRLRNVQFAVMLWGSVQWLPSVLRLVHKGTMLPKRLSLLLPLGICVWAMLSPPIRKLLGDLPEAPAYRSEQHEWVQQAREAHQYHPNDTLVLYQTAKTLHSLAAHSLGENPGADANRSFAAFYGIAAVRVTMASDSVHASH